MSKTDYKCDKCGAPLFLDAGGKSATCPACGHREIYIEDIFENQDKIFAVQVSKDIGEYISKGEAYLEMKEYTSAFESFAKAINIDPNDYRGWWGACRCRMFDNYLGEDNGYSRDFKKVQALASPAVRYELETKYETYLQVINKKREDKERELENAKKMASGEILFVKEYKGAKKSFKADIFIIILIFAFCPLVIALGIFYVERYLTFSIIFGLMLLIGGIFLVLRLKDIRKIIKLVELGKVDTVSELMREMKKPKKQDFLKLVREIIVSGHLVGYEIQEGEYFVKTLDLKQKTQKMVKTPKKSNEQRKRTK